MGLESSPQVAWQAFCCRLQTLLTVYLVLNKAISILFKQLLPTLIKTLVPHSIGK